MFGQQEKRVWATRTDRFSKVTGAGLPYEIAIRKSLAGNIMVTLIVLAGLIAIVYYIIFSGWSVFNVLFLVIFAVLVFYSVKSLLVRTVQLSINKTGISFCDSLPIKWTEMESTCIEKRTLFIRPGIERYYLTVQKITPGIFSEKIHPKFFEITGLEYTPRQIAHFIELYKQQAESVNNN